MTPRPPPSRPTTRRDHPPASVAGRSAGIVQHIVLVNRCDDFIVVWLNGAVLQEAILGPYGSAGLSSVTRTSGSPAKRSVGSDEISTNWMSNPVRVNSLRRRSEGSSRLSEPVRLISR